MKTIKYTLICLVAFLLWNGIVKGQSDSAKYKKFQVSVSYHRDYILTAFIVESASRIGPIYKYEVDAFHNAYFNYSLEANFKYYPQKFYYIKLGMLYRNQSSSDGYTVWKINHRTDYGDNNASLRYIDVPISFGFSFLNKKVVRPYIEVSINNAFIYYEKINSIYLDNPSQGLYFKNDTMMVDKKLKYYNLKGGVSAGCEFHIKKRYVVGVDVNIRTIPIFQTKDLIINTFKYSNFGFGLSFGYAIK